MKLSRFVIFVVFLSSWKAASCSEEEIDEETSTAADIAFENSTSTTEEPMSSTTSTEAPNGQTVNCSCDQSAITSIQNRLDDLDKSLSLMAEKLIEVSMLASNSTGSNNMPNVTVTNQFLTLRAKLQNLSAVVDQVTNRTRILIGRVTTLDGRIAGNAWNITSISGRLREIETRFGFGNYSWYSAGSQPKCKCRCGKRGGKFIFG